MGMEDNMAITTGNLYQKVPLKDINLTDPKVLLDSESKGTHRASSGTVYVECKGVIQPMESDEYTMRNIKPPYNELPIRDPI